MPIFRLLINFTIDGQALPYVIKISQLPLKLPLQDMEGFFFILFLQLFGKFVHFVFIFSSHFLDTKSQEKTNPYLWAIHISLHHTQLLATLCNENTQLKNRIGW